ncbi:hypothetical protein [Ensifer canadensis]|uniref:hypothetical protein n=1 Tax=Ensifer canadensis TaxID=555315 RepID=UPI0035E3D093
MREVAEANLLLLCYTPITAAARRLKVRRRRNMSEIDIASRNYKSLRDQAPATKSKKARQAKTGGFFVCRATARRLERLESGQQAAAPCADVRHRILNPLFRLRES